MSRNGDFRILEGDARSELQNIDSQTIDCCITSPPYYGLRDYGVDGQIGLEETPEEYIRNLVDVFREVKRVLNDDGTLWVVIGDSYAGSGKGAANYPDNAEKWLQGTNRGILGAKATGKSKSPGLKPKDLIGIPWMLAFALRQDGWYLRQDIIWQKPNAMPESVKDRCTKSHEYIFLLSKSRIYHYDNFSIKEECVNGDTSLPAGSKGTMSKNSGLRKDRYRKEKGTLRNKRDVWSVSTKGCNGVHFATFPESLISPCVLAGCRKGGTVLDPFCGSGTTGRVAVKNGRKFIGIELNREYAEISNKRIKEVANERCENGRD